MMTVASLFGSQAEARKALDALADSEFQDVDVRVYEKEVDEERVEMKPAGYPAAGTAAITPTPLSGVRDEDLSAFFVEAVESGQGVLVVAEVEEGRAADLEAFFRLHGGRTTEES